MNLNSKRKKKVKSRQQMSKIIENNWYIVKKIAKCVPQYIVLMITEGVIWGFINSLWIVYTLQLFNALDGEVLFWGWKGVVGIVAKLAIFYLFGHAFDRWYWIYYFPILKQKLYHSLHQELFEVAQKADLACYDDPEYYNDFVWAMNEADSRTIEVTQDIGKLVNRIVGLTTISSLLFLISPLVAFVIIIAAIFSTIIFLQANKVGYKQSIEQSPLWRKGSYINRVFHLQDYSKEIRMGHAGEILQIQYDENNEKLVKSQVKYGKKYFVLYGVFASTAGTGSYFFTIIYMFSKLISGQIMLGAFAASINATWTMRWLISDFCERLVKFPEHSLFIEKYREFLEREPKMKDGCLTVPAFEKLTVNNVCFSYQSLGVVNLEKLYGREAKYSEKKEEKKSEEVLPKKVLENICFEINKGDKIAIVGYNGAGKTTLIKLFMRLYDANDGEILYNGVNIKEFNIDDYRAHIGAVFQDYKLFAASIAENVWGADYKAENEADVKKALSAATFENKIEELKNGIDTHLTREFKKDGTNLSGGESQKVAIARVFAKPYELIIMDEPSSSLDPLAEYKLNSAILDYASDKTVIFISHRLSTTRMADKILMFDSGEIVEFGTHNELMLMCGKYAEMFNKQAEKYKAEAEAV